MPTLPLFDPSPTRPGESHGVRAPGGYEIWRFAAHDPSAQTWISVGFHLGYPSDEYLRAYQRFRRNPTRFAPPMPQQSPAVRVLILSGDRPVSSIARFAPVSPIAAGATQLALDQSRFDFDSDGIIHLSAPRIAVRFGPRSVPYQQKIALHSKSNHHWIVCGALYDVAGTVEIDEAKRGFSGTGTFDQQYGTQPRSGPLVSGHLFLADKVLLFQDLDPMLIAKISRDPLAIQSATAEVPTGWRYPANVKLNGSPLLSFPRVIDSNASSAWLQYEANFESEKGVCLCEVSS